MSGFSNQQPTSSSNSISSIGMGFQFSFRLFLLMADAEKSYVTSTYSVSGTVTFVHHEKQAVRAQ